MLSFSLCAFFFILHLYPIGVKSTNYPPSFFFASFSIQGFHHDWKQWPKLKKKFAINRNRNQYLADVAISYRISWHRMSDCLQTAFRPSSFTYNCLHWCTLHSLRDLMWWTVGFAKCFPTSLGCNNKTYKLNFRAHLDLQPSQANIMPMYTDLAHIWFKLHLSKSRSCLNVWHCWVRKMCICFLTVWCCAVLL